MPAFSSPWVRTEPNHDSDLRVKNPRLDSEGDLILAISENRTPVHKPTAHQDVGANTECR